MPFRRTAAKALCLAHELGINFGPAFPTLAFPSGVISATWSLSSLRRSSVVFGKVPIRSMARVSCEQASSRAPADRRCSSASSTRKRAICSLSHGEPLEILTGLWAA